MSRQRIKLIVSDFHLGAGRLLPGGATNFLEDFFHDGNLAEFLDYHARGDYSKSQVELVINGDFFNHLQVFPDEPNPALLTERVALARTEAIMSGHCLVFDALSRFAAAPNHSVTFIIGNHDIGLFWPPVQKLIVEKLGGSVRIWPEAVYYDAGVWIEHGNQQVAENWIDFEHPFLKGDSEGPIIKMPWGDLFVISFLNRMKQERPYVDKVYPFRLYLRWALIHDTVFALKAIAAGFVYFMQVLLRIGENRRFSRQQFVKIMKEFSFPVRMERAAKRIFAVHPGARVVAFGHGHRAAAKQFAGGKEYFNTGIWNEMISLDIGTMGRRLLLTFVEIEYDRDGVPHGFLREWKGAYHEVEEMGLL